MFAALAITAVGLLAQACFSARTIIQWIASERARKVLSPAMFWVFSTCGALLLALYGFLRRDFAVVLGQIVSYYVYLWNLRIKRVPVPRSIMAVLMLLPAVAVAWAAANINEFIADFFGRADLPLWMLAFGTVGQLLFTFRFIYQWWYSRRIGQSELPALFWWVSIAASFIVLAYGIMRLDIVLILGQLFGVIIYARNLWLGHRPSGVKN